ncbi:SGNH/GDSL hydrolase family protein [Candidatus Omnitrophota bacterium]
MVFSKKKWLLFGVKVFLFMVFLELDLRILGYVESDERKNTAFDTYYGQVDQGSWVLDCDIDAEKEERVLINFQNIPIEKPTGETRILFVGDSATAGAGGRFVDSFPFTYFRLMSNKFPQKKFYPINAGAVGLTTYDEYHLLKKELVHLSPDVVVLGVFMANDINFSLAHIERKINEGKASFGKRALNYFREHSAFVHFMYLKALVLNDRFKILQKCGLSNAKVVPIEFRLIDKRGLNMMSYLEGEVALYFKESTPLVDQAFENMENILFEFKKLAEEQDFKLIVALIPTSSTIDQKLNMLIYPDAKETIEKKLGKEISESDFDFNRPTQRILESCRRLSLHCVDPIDVFRSRGMVGITPKNDHLSAAGHLMLGFDLLRKTSSIVVQE